MELTTITDHQSHFNPKLLKQCLELAYRLINYETDSDLVRLALTPPNR
jgi:hypothetical protein